MFFVAKRNGHSWGSAAARTSATCTTWMLRFSLSAPPRNCDLFGGDIKMLHTAWFDWTGSPSGQNPDGTAKMVFGEWLLELAGKRGAV